MVLLVLVALVLLIRHGLRRGWPGAVSVKAWSASHREQVRTFVDRAPATFAYDLMSVPAAVDSAQIRRDRGFRRSSDSR